MRRMRTSKFGLKLLMNFEGFRPAATALGNGGWVIGYGHTKGAREGVRVTRTEAIAILREFDLPPIEKLIGDAVMAPLHQNEFDALVSLVFNIGGKAFLSSDVLSYLNSGEKLSAAESITAWRKARLNGRLIIVDALIRRRAAEKALFLRHPGGTPIAPSVFIRPQLDTEAARFVPSEPPVVATRERQTATKPINVEIEDTALPAGRKQFVVPDLEPSPVLESADNESPLEEVADDLVPVSALHDLPPLDDEPEAKDGASQTAPEIAASALVARLTRILGDPGKGDADTEEETQKPAPVMDDGPTPDEITRAISELADGPKPSDDDLPPLPDSIALADAADEQVETRAPQKRIFIDDLEPVADPLAVGSAAMADANLIAQPSVKSSSRLSWLIYVLLGLIGAVFAGVGLVGPSLEVGSVNTGLGQFGYIGLTLLGGMLAFLSLYFLFKSYRNRGKS